MNTKNYYDDTLVDDIDQARLKLIEKLQKAREASLIPTITLEQANIAKPIECIRRYVPEEKALDEVAKDLGIWQDPAPIKAALETTGFVPDLDDEIPF